MTDRRPTVRPKSRRAPSYCRILTAQPQRLTESDNEGPTTAAPGHTGGSFTNAPTYLPAGRGAFGFRQTS